MIIKNKEKEEAIRLRKRGYSYSEILKEVSVAKSTLSSWLRDVGLAKRLKQGLTEKRVMGQQKGAEARRQQRILLTNNIKKQAKKEIGRINKRDLWMFGIALYWAEGSKEKKRESRFQFSNSDPLMVRLFLIWLIKILKVPSQRIKFELYIHENHKKRLLKIRSLWSKTTGLPLSQFKTVYFKKHKIKTNRKNIGNNYYGVLKIGVKESSSLSRKVAGWIEGVCENCGVVE